MALSAKLVTIPLPLVLLLVYGLLLGCDLPVRSTILVNLFQHEKATAVGSYNCFRFAGATIGPTAGSIVSLAYGINAVFLTFGIVLLVAAWVVRQNLLDPFDE